MYKKQLNMARISLNEAYIDRNSPEDVNNKYPKI